MRAGCCPGDSGSLPMVTSGCPSWASPPVSGLLGAALRPLPGPNSALGRMGKPLQEASRFPRASRFVFEEPGGRLLISVLPWLSKGGWKRGSFLLKPSCPACRRAPVCCTALLQLRPRVHRRSCKVFYQTFFFFLVVFFLISINLIMNKLYSSYHVGNDSRNLTTFFSVEIPHHFSSIMASFAKMTSKMCTQSILTL